MFYWTIDVDKFRICIRRRSSCAAILYNKVKLINQSRTSVNILLKAHFITDQLFALIECVARKGLRSPTFANVTDIFLRSEEWWQCMRDESLAAGVAPQKRCCWQFFPGAPLARNMQNGSANRCAQDIADPWISLVSLPLLSSSVFIY